MFLDYGSVHENTHICFFMNVPPQTLGGWGGGGDT
jgi:hypothetical protein